MEQVRKVRFSQKVHVLAWMIALEKDGYIPCIFKNCRFMAFDVDEMNLHFEHCIPDNGGVLVECNYCELGTDKLEKLLYHKVNSHSYEATGDELSMINDFANVLRKKGDSNFQERAWQLFLEKRNYMKCFIGNCHYVTGSLSDMKQHYLHDCKFNNSSSLEFTCEYCEGRTRTAKDLELHMETSHSNTSAAVYKHPTKRVSDEIIKQWSLEIQTYKQARCLVPNCRFVDNSISVLRHHLVNCTGTKRQCLLCNICNHWLLNETKLSEHKRCIHNRVKKINKEHGLFRETEEDYLEDLCIVKENIASSEEDIVELIIDEVDLTHNHDDPDVKKYGGTTKCKVFPDRIQQTDLSLVESTQAIDYEKPDDNSRIQFAEDFVEKNTCSLDIVNVSASHLGCMLYPEETFIFKKPHNVKSFRVYEREIKIPLPSKVNQVKQQPTSLEMLGDEMMKKNKNSSSVSVSIQMVDKDWTVSVPENVCVSQQSDKFPENSDELMKSIKRESSRLLQLISRKTAIRNDFDLNSQKKTKMISFIIDPTKGSEASSSYEDIDESPCGLYYSSITDECIKVKKEHYDSVKAENSEISHSQGKIIFELENNGHTNFDKSLIENSEAIDSVVNNDLSISENIVKKELTEKQSSEDDLNDSFFGFSDEESTIQKYNSFVSVFNKISFNAPYTSPMTGVRNIKLKKKNSRYNSHNINNTQENSIRKSEKVDKNRGEKSRNGVSERGKSDVDKRKCRSKSLPAKVYKKNSSKIQTRKSTVVDPLKIDTNGTLKNVKFSVLPKQVISQSGDKAEDKLCESSVSSAKNETIDSVKWTFSDNSVNTPTVGIGLEVSEESNVDNTGNNPLKNITATEKSNNSSFLSEGAVDSDDSRELSDEHFDNLENTGETILENSFQNKIGKTFSTISNILVHSENANGKICSLMTNGKISGSILMDTSANMNSSELLANTSVVISLDGTYEGESSSETTEAISNSPIKLENTVDKDGISVTLRNVLENIGDSEGSSSLDPTDNSVGSEVSEKANKNDPKVNKTRGKKSKNRLVNSKDEESTCSSEPVDVASNDSLSESCSKGSSNNGTQKKRGKSKTRLEENNKDADSSCCGEPMAELAVTDSVSEPCSEITQNPNNGIQQKGVRMSKGRPEEEINDEEPLLRNPKKKGPLKKFEEYSLASKQTLKHQNKPFSETGRNSSPSSSKNDSVSRRRSLKSKTRSEQILEGKVTKNNSEPSEYVGTDSEDLESDLETMPLLLRARKFKTRLDESKDKEMTSSSEPISEIAANDPAMPKRSARMSRTRMEETAANDSDSEVMPKRSSRMSRTRMEETTANDSDTEVMPKRSARMSRTRMVEIAPNDSDIEVMPKRSARMSRTRMVEIAPNDSDTEVMPKRSARMSRTRMEETAANDSDTEVMPKRSARMSRTRVEEIAANDSDADVMPKRSARMSRTRVEETAANDSDAEVMPKRTARKSRTRMEEIAANDSDAEVMPKRSARMSRTRMVEIAANDSDSEVMPKRSARMSRTRMEEIAANDSDAEVMPKRSARMSRTRVEEIAANDSDAEVMPKRTARKSRTRMEEIAANDSDAEVMSIRSPRKSRTRIEEIKDESISGGKPVTEIGTNDSVDLEIVPISIGRKSRTRLEEIKDEWTCSSDIVMEIAACDSVDLVSDSEIVPKRRARKSRTRLEEIKDEESTCSEPTDSVNTKTISRSRSRKRKAVPVKDEEASGNSSGFLGFEIENTDSTCVDESLDSSNLEPPVNKKRDRKPSGKTEESDAFLLETMSKEDVSDSKADSDVKSEEFASSNALASSEVTANHHSLDTKMVDSSVNQSLDSSVPEIRVPKKRGRKPKVKTADSDVVGSTDPNDSMNNTPKDTSGNSPESTKTVQLSSRGRSRKVAVYFDYDLEFSDDDTLNKSSSSTPKKKRRKKFKSYNSFSETSINSDLSRNLDGLEDTSGELPGSTPKKIRRKRKILTENGDTVEDNKNPDISGNLTEPKRRGRKPYKKSNDIEWDPTAYIASGLTPVLQRTIKKKKRKNLIPDYRKEFQNKSNSSGNLDIEDKTESQNSDISTRMSEYVPKLRIPSDSELCTTRPQLFALMKNQTLSGRIDTASKFTNDNAKVKCAICGEIMAVKEYKNTHLLKHNFLSWLEGEEPMDLGDKDAMMLIMARGKRVYKNFVFKCELCGEVKKSALGYFCHTVSCGKSASEIEDMMVNCPYCKRLMMPTSIDAHMYYSHRIEPEEKKEEPVTPSATRKAATMCLNKILGLTTSNGDYEYNYNPNDTMEETAQYTKRRKRKLSKHITSLWRKQLAEGKAGSCSMPGCTFTSLSVDELSQHFRNCGDVVLRYKCNNCGFVCFNEDEIKVHTQSCNSYNKSEPDSGLYRGDSDTSDEENNEFTCFPFLRKAELSMARRGKQLLGCGYGVRFFKPALQWMDSQYESCFSQDEIFSNYGTYTDMIQEMEPEECKDFTILLKSKSMRISFQDSEWEEMETFRSKKIGGKNGLAYTGGAVWGLGWCPGEGEQFLAVSTRTGRETDVDISCTSTGPSMLQIWSLGNINNSPDTGLERLTFEYGICDDNGGAWGLAWCPGPGTRTYTRLGLVVLATFSGSLPIYSVPHPSVLPTSAEGTRLYKTEPVLRLEISSSEQWQCTCISWSELKPHNIIAAGFANGLVAVWDLSVESKLLRRGNILYPFKTFSAHNTVVTGISLSPMNEHSLVSTSFDGTYKYWDLKETGAPISSLRKGVTTSVAWMRHWLAAATCFDNAYVLSQTSLNMNSLRSYMYSSAPYVGYLDATAWSLSANDWLNCIAAAYEDGQVLLCFALKQLLNSHDEKKRYLKGMLQCNLHDFDEEESIEEMLSLDEPKEKKYIHSNSYVDSVGKYGLKIKADVTLDSIRMPVMKNTNTFVDTYPLNSANRVSWNPNKQSFLYLATGLQAGFIIVSKLHLNKQESTLVEKLSDPTEDQQESILIDQLSESTVSRQESMSIDTLSELTENRQESISIDTLPELIENQQESLPIDISPELIENQQESLPIDISPELIENQQESLPIDISPELIENQQESLPIDTSPELIENQQESLPIDTLPELIENQQESLPIDISPELLENQQEVLIDKLPESTENQEESISFHESSSKENLKEST